MSISRKEFIGKSDYQGVIGCMKRYLSSQNIRHLKGMNEYLSKYEITPTKGLEKEFNNYVKIGSTDGVVKMISRTDEQNLHFYLNQILLLAQLNFPPRKLSDIIIQLSSNLEILQRKNSAKDATVRIL